MTKAEEMAKLTKESTYNKHKDAIEKTLDLINNEAQQGLNSCTLKLVKAQV